MQENPVLQNILTRRSVRAYETAPVPQEKLEQVLQAGIWAPSASNRQTWHFTVITDASKIDAINEAGKAWMATSHREDVAKRGQDASYHVFHHAPCLLLVSYETARSWGKIDSALAAENIMLAAHALGLGTCYIGLLTPWLESGEAAFVQDCPIPKGYAPFHFITLGIPTKVGPAPARKEGTSSYL